MQSFFSFKFDSFTRRVHVFTGAYSKRSQDEQGGIRIFFCYLHLLQNTERDTYLKPIAEEAAFAEASSCSKSDLPTMNI